MMKIKNFTKKFGSRIIYDNFSITLPKNGVVAITGESGSGKTTLLNAIAGLDFDYSGEIIINSTNLKLLSDDKIRDYRIHNIGYVFQNFNLLNLDNVETNIVLPFDSTSNASKIIKERKVNELTKLLGISKLKKENVNKLSGGEKQRVAIARAMINSPKIILCDEPTGALDEKNSEQIYDILKKISVNALVIIASHDYEGVSKIADLILEINDGKVFAKDGNGKNRKEEQNLLENHQVVSESTLTPNFKFKHSFHKLKSKKYRSLITNAMLSLSLTGIGLSIILATSVSTRIQEAFSNIINGNQIVMSPKQESVNTFSNIYSASLSKIKEINNKYEYYLDGYGANYIVNFEDFFKDRNDVDVTSTAYRINIPSLSTRSINEFKWLKSEEVSMYPYSIFDLEDDQVVLGLTYQDMVNLCFNLQILRNFVSLGNYIEENGLFITLSVANGDWQYDDEQIFEVKAVTEANKSIFYHTNPLWNEVVFEKMMLMPSIDSEIHYFPWEMFKLYYFKTIDEPSKFLDAVFFDPELQDCVFERTNSDYQPLLCNDNEVCSEKRVFAYLADKNGINPWHIDYLSKLDKDIKDYYFISDYGYASYASNLLSGFSKNVFVSCDESKVIEAIDADSQLQEDINVQIQLPSDVVQGNFLNGISGGLRFSSKMDKLCAGRKPNNLHEIVISTGLARKIDEQGIGIGKYLYIAGENNEYISDEDFLNKEYRTEKVVIVGLVEEEQNYLYHNQMWTISFFRDCLSVSSFYLIPKSVVIELDQNVDSSLIIDKYSKMFKEYIFASPVNELSKSIETTLNYANSILIGFSILASLISILLLGTVVLLNVLESKDEIRLFEVIGIKNKDINSLFVYQSIIQGMVAFVFSAIELVVVDFVISKALGDTLHTSLSYSFNFLPIGIVFIFALLLPYLTSSLLVRVLMKKNKNVAKSKVNC